MGEKTERPGALSAFPHSPRCCKELSTENTVVGFLFLLFGRSDLSLKGGAERPQPRVSAAGTRALTLVGG